MRITTRLKVTSTATIVVLLVLIPLVIWSFIEFKNAKNNYVLANTLKVNALERASFGDQYFLYREDRAKAQWEENKKIADEILHQANNQFHREQDQRILERLQKNIDDSSAVFHRIVNNTDILNTNSGNRQVYEDLDKRLCSQLLMKDNAAHDMATDLMEISTQQVEVAYIYLIIIFGVFAITLAFSTILTSTQLDRLIRKRLGPLHDGTKIVAEGNLSHRLQCDGTDEFSELALSVNVMTENLQASLHLLETEIAERKNIENKLVRANNELQQFTNIAAHHLQEPARRLVSFAQRLKSSLSTEQLTEDVYKSLSFIEQSATRQVALIRDIQLYLAAAQPRAAINKIAIADIISNLLQHIHESNLQVEYQNLCSVSIDRPRLTDIFRILLDNALRYCHPKLTLHIKIDTELKLNRVVCRVADNGIGIPEEYRERVFGVFERLQVSDNQNSTGIGLAIVRRIIESCGGTVSLQETPGGGTTVVFDLPV